jgi:hypothetical protein
MSEKPTEVQGAAKALISQIIPFDKLDEAATTYKGIVDKTTGKLARQDFFSLPYADRQAILKNFKFDTWSPIQAYQRGRYLTGNINKLTDAGFGRAVLAKLNNTLKEDMDTAFQRLDPTLYSNWVTGNKITFEQAERIKTQFYESVLDKEPIAGERLVGKALSQPSSAAKLMSALDKTIDEDGNFVSTGDTKYRDMVRKYAADKLSKVGVDRPEEALKLLQDDQKGYKPIFGDSYDAMVTHWTHRLSEYSNTTQGNYIKFLQQSFKGTEPLEVLDKLANSKATEFTDYVLKITSGKPQLQHQIGEALFESALDEASSTGSFRDPDSVLDPVAFSSKILERMPQLQKFMDKDQAAALKNIAQGFQNLSVGNAKGTIASYRTWASLSAVGIGMAFGTKAGLASGTALLAGPYLFMKASTNPLFATWLREGLYLQEDTKAYLNWIARGTIIVNSIKTDLAKQQKAQQVPLTVH